MNYINHINYCIWLILSNTWYILTIQLTIQLTMLINYIYCILAVLCILSTAYIS